MSVSLNETAGIVRRAMERRRLVIERRARANAAAAVPAASAPEDFVRRIADDMIDVAGISGAAEEADLVLRGWPVEMLRRFGDRARDVANAAVMRRAA